jgi:hypothetical protein
MNKILESYKDLPLVIATKHKKEVVIQPYLENLLKVRCLVPEDIDTDQLGMFSGEVERKETPLSAARKKCLLGFSLTNTKIAVASEGSFYPHPQIGFVPVNEELLLFKDLENDIEIHVKQLSMDTNFNQTEVKNFDELAAFCEKIGFPTHGIVLKYKNAANLKVEKDFLDLEEVRVSFERAVKRKIQQIFAETDMRAHKNPKRMKVIGEAAEKLVQVLQSSCEKCDAIGFSTVDAKPGLKCKNCGLPTRSTLYHIYKCAICGHTENKYFPNGKENENPMYCDFCNP